MLLPESLRRAIDQLASACELRSLARASRELTASYKSAKSASPAVDSAVRRLAYLLVRMPATYAAAVHALRQSNLVCPGLSPSTLLDLGAGPGTASWAAAELFPSLASVTCVERDPEWIDLGGHLMASAPCSALSSARWVQGDLRSQLPLGDFDLVVLSYALGELPPVARSQLLQAAWQRARAALLIVEPGTRPGSAVIVEARRQLLTHGAQFAAPCPHHAECPMASAGDWCHFAERVERTSLHRRLKDAELGYEDEKFSYLAAVRSPVFAPSARIVRHPQHRPGHVQLALCTASGLRTQTIGKSRKDLYRSAKQSCWGDPWQLE